MKVDKYLPALRQARGQVVKSATRGERVIGSLMPNRSYGWGSWGQTSRFEQVQHLRNWTMVAVDAICCKVASVMPNLAYVVDQGRPGHTTKACHRLPGQFGGSVLTAKGGWSGESVGISGGPHSFMTMGEYRSKALSVVKPHEELEPLEADHRLRRLFENPNPVDTFFDLAYELQMFEELCGVSYLWMVPNGRQFGGLPCELWVIPSHWVWPRTGGNRYVSPEHPHADELIKWYEVRPWGGVSGAGSLFFPPSEVSMNRWKSPIDKIDGYSKLAGAAQWIDSEESISKSRWAQFINQARPEFWVELGEGYADPDDDRIARIEAKFAAKIQGEYNYGKPVITPPGAKITPLSFSPTEMAYFQSEEQIRDMILSVFRVPPAAVGIVKEMTYGSLLACLASFCSFCLNPRLAMRGQRLTKDLGSRWDRPGRKVRIWWDDCVPADPAQVNSDIAQDQACYAITPNEVRALRGRGPYKAGGDDPMGQGPGGIMPIPLNTGDDLEDLAKLIAPMTQQGQEGQPPPGGEGAPPPEEGAEGVPGEPAAAEDNEAGQLQSQLSDAGAGTQEDAGIEEPNGQPSKALVGKGRVVTKGPFDLPKPKPIIGGFYRPAALTNIGFVLGSGRANLDTEQEIMEMVGAESWSEVGRKVQAQSDDGLKRILELINRKHPSILPAGWDSWKRKTLAKSFFPGKSGGDRDSLTTEGLSRPLIDLPDVRQEDNYSCGAACAMSVGRHFGVGPKTLEEWKTLLGTTERDSTRPGAIVKVLRGLGLRVRAANGLTLDDLRAAWAEGRPVICCMQEYGVPGKQASFDYGHYVAVIGCGHGHVFVQDPSIDNALAEPGGSQGDKPDPDVAQAPGRSLITEERWLEGWHDKDADGTKYVRFGIIVGRKTPRPFEPRQKDNAGGTCKPGQTQTRTGCTPAGDSGGGGKKGGGHPGATHGSSVKVKLTKKRAFDGENPVPTKTTLTKQETGRVGEAVVLAYLKTVAGRKDARPMNTAMTNFPIDLIEDHAPTEVKAGLCSNGVDAQKWRLTFSKESDAEKAAYAKMTPEQRGKWNAEKQKRIRQRKEAVIKKLEQETGKKLKPKTMTVVINPDTRTADVYEFDGWHDIIRWRSSEAKAAYRGSVNYE